MIRKNTLQSLIVLPALAVIPATGLIGSDITSATTGTDGKWSLNLDPLEASAEPQEMKITENTGKSLTLIDLLVGEVWMASGQSNMQWTAAKSSVHELVKALAEKGENPPIREFKISSTFASLHPIERTCS